MAAQSTGRKSTFIAYFLWLTLGYAGIHHWYLGRDEQFILYGQSAGLFALGWLADFFLLPHYIRRANGDTVGSSAGKGLFAWLWARTLALVRFSVTFGMATLYALMMESCWDYDNEDSRFIEGWEMKCLAYLAVAFAAALGARLVANVGESRIDVFSPMVAAGLMLAVCDSSRDENSAPAKVMAGFGAALAATVWRRVPSAPAVEAAPGSGKREKTDKTPKATAPSTSSAVVLTVRPTRRGGCCFNCSNIMAILGFWVVGSVLVILHGGTVPVNATGRYDQAGLRQEKLGVYMYHNREEVLNTVQQVWDELKKYQEAKGWEGIRQDVYEWMDDTDEYTTLGLEKGATLSDVKKQYRKLAKELHPDRLPHDIDEKSKSDAITKFRKVQQAYETLTKQLGGRGRGKRGGGEGDSESSESGSSGSDVTDSASSSSSSAGKRSSRRSAKDSDDTPKDSTRSKRRRS